jgi:hypothetical protein
MTDTAATPAARTFPLEPGGTVEISLSSGSVHMRGTDADRVVVRSRDGEPLGDEIAIDAEPARVRIRDGSANVRLGPFSLRTSPSPDLDIDVPAGAAIRLRTMSGDVDARGIAGESRWTSASGTLRIEASGGPVQLESMSGDAVLEASAAIDLGIRTVSGDIRIRAPRLRSSDVGTTSGDVRIEAALDPAGRHGVSSVSGDVEVATPSPVRLEAQTIAGDVHGQGPHRAEGGRSRRTLIAGDGSVALSVRTTSGDVRLRVLGAAPAPPVPPVAPVPPVPFDVPEPPTAPRPPAAPDAPAPPSGATDGPVPDVPAVPATGPRPGSAPRPIDPEDDTHAWSASEPLVDRREAARLDILRALERGDLDLETASHRLEILEESGPRFFRGWC